jgi:CSLREA domain-containing protein
VKNLRSVALPLAVAVAFFVVALLPALPDSAIRGTVSVAQGYPSYLAAFKTKYPTTTLDTRLSCMLCHTSESFSNPVNCYKRDLANLGAATPIATRLNMLDAVDSDGDGVANGVEATTARPGGGVGFSPGLVGSNGRDPCGANASLAVTNVCESPTDTDGDGTIDCNDGCPNDPAKTTPGACGCGNPDVDSDGDGVLDCVDACPGVNDSTDANGNGLADCLEGIAFMVNTTDDTLDANPGDGICADAGGKCSLRAAVMEANANIDSNTIVLPAGTYILTIPGANVGAESGDLNIIESVNIQGAGAQTTIVDGNAADCVFDLGGFQSTISISGVTIQNGHSTAFGSGGVYSLDNNLTLTNCAIVNNSLTYSSGYGAGVFSAGPLTMTNCLIANNTLTGSLSAFGGGVCLYFGGTSTLTNCTITGNSAGGTVDSDGGGIAVIGNATTLTNCTITNNTCTGQAGGAYFDSGSTTTLTVRNTIISGNIGSANCEAKPGSTITSAGYNLEDADTCNFHSTGDLLNASPNLDVLADNGGPTKTHGLLAGSPAIDAGDPAGGPTNDQRGLPRPVDGAGGSTAISDIGAFEFSDCDGNTLDDAREVADGVQLPDCDEDGIPDACELTTDCNQNGIPDSCESDADGDGTIDACDPCPNSASNVDSDGDGTPDCNDGCPNDPSKTAPGDCGCGVADADSDEDGVADCVDVCPDFANADQSDTDNDGSGDACDEAPTDPAVGGANQDSGGGEAGAGEGAAGNATDCGTALACGPSAANMMLFTFAGILCMKRLRRIVR